MSTPVRARRLTDDEGQYLLRLVRRGVHDSVRYRRALIIMASSSGTRVPAIARLVAADEDTFRGVVHAFNDQGLAMLAPRWGPGRPRRIADADIDVLVATAKTRPARLGLPFTHWSIRKLTAYLDGDYGHRNPAWVPARPIEAQFGPLRTFTMANSNYPNHPAMARALHAYLRWRNANNRHPDVIAAQRRERARVRSEHHQRWGRPPETQAA